MKRALLLVCSLFILPLGCSAGVEAGGHARTAAAVSTEGEPAPAGREERQPVSCHGNDHIELRGAYIRTSGDAVEAHGNCRIVLTESDVQAGGVALVAHGNARIEVLDSRIEGSTGAVDASGNATIVAVSSTLTGPIHKSGNASVDVTR